MNVKCRDSDYGCVQRSGYGCEILSRIETLNATQNAIAIQNGNGNETGNVSAIQIETATGIENEIEIGNESGTEIETEIAIETGIVIETGIAFETGTEIESVIVTASESANGIAIRNLSGYDDCYFDCVNETYFHGYYYDWQHAVGCGTSSDFLANFGDLCVTHVHYRLVRFYHSQRYFSEFALRSMCGHFRLLSLSFQKHVMD